MQVNIDYYKQQGAQKIKQTDTVIVEDLQDNLHINQHGSQEINLDVSNLKIQGSTSTTRKVDTFFTEYSVKINKNKLKMLAMEKCRDDYECNSYINDDATFLNAMYSKIAVDNDGNRADVA
jgi:hypothetical protein